MIIVNKKLIKGPACKLFSYQKHTLQKKLTPVSDQISIFIIFFWKRKTICKVYRILIYNTLFLTTVDYQLIVGD